MKRSFAWSAALVLIVALSGRSYGQDKVYTVGKKKPLKIEGAVEANDPKVDLRPNPNIDKAIALPAKQFAVKFAAGTRYRPGLVTM